MGGGLNNLSIYRFRSYHHYKLDVQGNSCIVLVGPNGAGKTNILEALSLFYPGRGLRRAKASQLVTRTLYPSARPATHSCSEIPFFPSPSPTLTQDTQPPDTSPLLQDNPQLMWGLAGLFQTPSGPLQLSLTQPHEGRRQIACNGVNQRSIRCVLDHLIVAWCSPEIDNFCSHNPKLRRRLLDRLVLSLDPEHAKRCHTYTQSVSERNGVLASPFFKDRATWLTSLEHIIASTYIDILKARQAYTQRYNQDPLDLGLPRCRLSLEGDLIPLLPHGTQAYNLAVGVLYQQRQHPYKRLIMPPTHLNLYHPKGHDVGFCSTGEQKAVILAITLESLIKAHDSSRLSLLLLDDVTSYQDDCHRQALFNALGYVKAQVWMTGTEVSLFLGFPAHYIHILSP